MVRQHFNAAVILDDNIIIIMISIKLPYLAHAQQQQVVPITDQY